MPVQRNRTAMLTSKMSSISSGTCSGRMQIEENPVATTSKEEEQQISYISAPAKQGSRHAFYSRSLRGGLWVDDASLAIQRDGPSLRQARELEEATQTRQFVFDNELCITIILSKRQFGVPKYQNK